MPSSKSFIQKERRRFVRRIVKTRALGFQLARFPGMRPNVPSILHLISGWPPTTVRRILLIDSILLRCVISIWIAGSPAIAAEDEPTVYVTMISHFDAPWNMTAEDIAAFEKLTNDHPKMRWTHLYNPVAYTQETPLRDEMERFVKRSKKEHHAEIGVHLHMYKSLLDAAGVKFVPHPSLNAQTVEGSRDDSGYAVPLTRYSRDEIGRILAFTHTTFRERDLSVPKTFCAGFYATSLALQKELAARGYTTSAAAFPPGADFGAQYAPTWHKLSGWNLSVTYKTGPYQVSQESILPTSQAPYIVAGDERPLVEVPQTCKIDWMVTAEDMKVIFKSHLAIAEAEGTTAVCLAIHESQVAEYFEKYDEVLAYIDEHIASESKPVVQYVTASELREAMLLQWATKPHDESSNKQ